MKRKYTTAQVVAILSRHHDWMAGTLSCPNKADERCYYQEHQGGRNYIVFEFLGVDGEWVKNDASEIEDRDDWEIVKPKRKRVVVGKMKPVRGSLEWDVDASELDHSKTYKLVAVEQ